MLPAPELVPSADRGRVRRAFASYLPVRDGLEARLAGVVADVLSHPGSLARAQLAYGIASGAGMPRGPALRLATALEYFHAASLIFDDMPAMDDADSRRGRPCPHVVHGEAAAVLGALALVNRAYALVWDAISTIPARRRARASALVAECLGLDGILDGQSRDVHFEAGGARLSEVQRVAAAKTVPLIRLAVVLPALVAGAGEAALSRLERLSADWGLAYQILDDFKDLLLSEDEAGKTVAHDRALGRPNLPGRAGPREALRRLDRRLASARRRVEALGSRPSYAPLRKLQEVLEGARASVASRLGAVAA